MRTKIVVVILFLCITRAVGQTVSDIERRYGKAVPVYSVSEHIWMTPEYASDGQVCRMTLYPKHMSGTVTYLGATLQFKELCDLLNSIVPPDQRGLKKELNFGATATGGPAAWTTYPYQQVTFTFISPMLKSPGFAPLRKGEFEFSIPTTDYVATKESLTPSADDFVRSESSKTEIVTIKWSDRKCAD